MPNTFTATELAEHAVNVALKTIQDELGVKSGDFAAIHFSGSSADLTVVKVILREYIRAELAESQRKLRMGSLHGLAETQDV